MDQPKEYVQVRVDRINDADLHRRPNKWIAALNGTAGARRVLDIACGMGYDAFAWARSGKSVIGIDYSHGLLKNAAAIASREGLDVHFVVANATLLPFRDGAFDISYSENLFEHVPQWQQLGLEARRVLAAGGSFFVRTTNRHCPRNPEINHMHFYPLLPDALKRPILSWIMKNRPAWVNYTAFPAVNWFTHRGLARFFERLGFDTYEIFDLISRDSLTPRKRRFFLPLSLLQKHRILRFLVYPLFPSVQILAVKHESPLAQSR
jgi:ubiquinone/menaquinone biosynthesis C-methylase UbiE